MSSHWTQSFKALCLWILIALCTPLFASVAKATDADVVVSLPPLREMLEILLPPGVTVASFLPPSAAPETFDPAPSALLSLGQAKIFVAAEVPFEKIWLPRIEKHRPQLKVFRPFKNAYDTLVSHQVAPDGQPKSIQDAHHHDHEHDPHLWLSPQLLVSAVRSIAQSIRESNLPAAWKEGLDARESKATAHYEALINDISKTLGTDRSKSRSFFVYHPSWGLFAESFGLKQVALEDRGHSPGPAALQQFLADFKSSGSKVIFAQPQMSTKEATQAAKLSGSRVELVDPLAEKLVAEMKRFSQLLKADFDGRR